MSLGVNLLTAITRRIAEALDADYDIEIVEMHHRQKVDAPSGTALMLGAAAAEGRRVNLKETSVRSRDGHTGARRRVTLASRHCAAARSSATTPSTSRRGRAHRDHAPRSRPQYFRPWSRQGCHVGPGQRPGLFSMIDVLGL